MNIPDKLKILGFDWIIEFNADVTEGENAFGSTHPSSQKIFLDPRTTRQNQEQTLYHEILHAIIWTMGLRNLIDSKTEEILVNTLSQGMYQVLKENNIYTEEELEVEEAT